MIGKMETSKIEHRLILITTLIIPILLFIYLLIFLSTELYEYISPPPAPIFSVDDWGAKPTLPLFRICVFLSLIISFFLLEYKRIFLSMLTFILPVISLVLFVVDIHWRVRELLENANYIETLNYYGGKSSIEIAFTYLDNLNFVLLISVLILFFWQISILLRMLIKTLQRKPELP